MRIDFYTKAVLTVIAIGVGLLVFDQKPVKDAHAAAATKLAHVDEIADNLARLEYRGEQVHDRVSTKGWRWYEFHRTVLSSGEHANFVRRCTLSSGRYFCDDWFPTLSYRD